MRPGRLEPPRPIIGPQGPQPCASTNSATGAWRRPIIAPRARHRPFRPTAAVLYEHMFGSGNRTGHGREVLKWPSSTSPSASRRSSTSSRRYSAEARLSAHRARHRQGDRAHVVVDRARAPRQPREGRAAAARPDQAAGDRAAGGQGQAGGRRRRRAAARRPGRRGRAGARRGEHRGVRRVPGSPAATRASSCCASPATR